MNTNTQIGQEILFSLGTLGLCALLSNIAYGQNTPQSASSSIVSSENVNNIQPGQPPAPKEEESAIIADPASLLPDLPALPRGNATLVGGTIERLDRIRDRITVHVFGGGRMNALFDPRTRIYRGQKEATVADLREGERVYLDTMLDGNAVFARAIRVNAAPATGQSQGVVLEYRSDRGQLMLRDALSPSSISVRVNSSTKFTQASHPVPASTVVAGTLVAVEFTSEGNGHDVAREISILALPGTHYTFVGQIVHVDLRSGLLVLNSSTDRKTYEVYLDPSVTPDDNLQPGALVSITATYEKARYVAHNVTITGQGK